MIQVALKKEVRFEAVLSRGPGGQNVNRTASAAQLYWDYGSSKLLSSDEKHRLTEKLANMINNRGEIYIRSDEFRDLDRNKSRCLDKLIAHVRTALHIPKKRKKTKPSKASREKRHKSKQKRGQIKKMRGRVTDY